ncbi:MULTISPECIES: pectate lyase family protein [Vibrio]|uniref:Pectate lyase n=2 Tax=Vibrio TaxID=662 RepID=A0A7X4LK42_9VIBR|nr:MULTISPECIES: pectate lyase [Vibrio]MBF8999870.1 pectate lyase [Vibrio nitrifigilis]MZI93453.1 pectate lyase [Vibrio eleionomae]
MNVQALKKSAVALCFLSSLSLGVAQAADTGGYATTTGGDSYTSTTVTTLAELKAAIANGSHHIIVKGTIYGGSSLTTLTFATTDWNNTTIEGASGGNAALENIQLKFDGEQLSTGTNIENIKISNLSFYGNISDLQNLPTQIYGTDDNVGINYEGVSLRRITNAYITHCNFFDTSDDLMSVTLSSDDVTISYNHFYFTDDWANMSPDPLWNWVGSYTDLAGERLAMVIGANYSDSYVATGYLHVTVHHNWFGPNMRGRPLYRGWVHQYSNLFDNHPALTGTVTAEDGNEYTQKQYEADQIVSGGVLYSESNYFYYTNNTNTISEDSSGYDYKFYEKNNTYSNTTGTSSTGDSFSSFPGDYSYTVTSASNVPSVVEASAGPQ